jgi:beta-galactosidase
VVTEVRRGAELMDVVNSPLGFRWLRVDPDQGAFLNGAPIWLVGTNRHQDVAGYGNAVPDALHRRDVRLIDATGFDFLRLAHYPQDPAVLDEMDRVGLVGWEEIPVVNTITMSDAFADNAERMLVEMIRQHYNHPSIVFWGYMNEIMLRIPDPEPDGYLEAIVALAERLEATAHAEDPGRITVSAISFGEIDNGTGFQDVPEVLGLNLYFGWYYRDEDGIGAFLDSLHARHPERPLMISEYGAGSDERIHAPEPVAFDFSTEHQQRVHEAHLPSFLDRGYLAGTAVWNHFDFGSAGRDDSRPDVNQKGLFRFDRTPKDVWHYYRAMLLDEPVLHVATDDHALRAGSAPVDAARPVRVYANLGEVALAVNGVEVGTRAVSNGSATWTVTLESGENRIVARGTRAGRTIRDEAVVIYEDRTDLFDARGHRGHRGGPDDPDDPDDPGDRPTTRDRVGTVAPPLRIAVNAGAGYAYADGSGTVWEADRPHEIGGWGYVGGEARLSHRRIRGSEDDALFQATREGASAYRFDVVDGAYDVRIALAETRFDRPGARSVTVHVNGVPVFEDVDLAASSGPHTAVERTVRVSATGGEGILVKLEATGGGTTVSGVEVHRR